MRKRNRRTNLLQWWRSRGRDTSSVGSGSFSVGTSGGCSWAAAANAGWIAITSGDSGSNNGTVSYSVAINANSGSRTGTIAVQGRTFTVFQDGAGSLPLITSAMRNG